MVCYLDCGAGLISEVLVCVCGLVVQVPMYLTLFILPSIHRKIRTIRSIRLCNILLFIYISIYVALYLVPSTHGKIRTISSIKLNILLCTNLSIYLVYMGK